MPYLGEIRKALETGHKGRGNKYIWQACIDCGKEHWVFLRKGLPVSSKCLACGHRSKDASLKPGYQKSSKGYIVVHLPANSPFISMADKRHNVYEQRLIMAQHLGRPLEPWELVHHKDGVRTHNEFSNLLLSTRRDHAREHLKGLQVGYQDGFVKGYQDGFNKGNEVCKNCPLGKEIRLVRLQNKIMLEQIRELNLRLAEEGKWIRI